MKEIWFWMARDFAELLCPLACLLLLMVVWFVSVSFIKASRWWNAAPSDSEIRDRLVDLDNSDCSVSSFEAGLIESVVFKYKGPLSAKQRAEKPMNANDNRAAADTARHHERHYRRLRFIILLSLA